MNNEIIFGISPLWDNEIWAKRGSDVIIAKSDGNFIKGSIGAFISFISRIHWGVKFTEKGRYLKEEMIRMFDNSKEGEQK